MSNVQSQSEHCKLALSDWHYRAPGVSSSKPPTITVPYKPEIFGFPDSPQRIQNAIPETQPFEVTVTRRENEGFGFVIISSVTRVGSMIGTCVM